MVERAPFFYGHCTRAGACGPGEVPDDLVHAAAAAEAEFIQAARDELIRSGAITPLVSRAHASNLPAAPEC